MHLAVYRCRPEVSAVLHAHPPKATAFAVCRRPIVLPGLAELALSVGEIGIVPYAAPSTSRLAALVAEGAAKHDALLLSGHGALTLGRSLMEAYLNMETVEQAAAIALDAAALGGPVPFTAEEEAELARLRREVYHK